MIEDPDECTEISEWFTVPAGQDDIHWHKKLPTEVMADGPWQYRWPRLRKDWDTQFQHRRGDGKVTQEETLWVVIIAMAIARDRNQIQTDHNVENYVLHFWCLWSVVYSCFTYSARFNDHDIWHAVLWSIVTLLLLFQCACMHESMFYLAGFTCALHLTVCVAHTRVALLLPRARVFCTWMGCQSFIAAVIFAIITRMVHVRPDMVRMLLIVNVFLQPVGYTLYKLIILALDGLYPADPTSNDPEKRTQGLGDRCHVPADFAYLYARHQGTHMLMIVCALVGPVALHMGTTQQSAVIGTMAIVYAILLKLAFLDVDKVQNHGEDSKRHPLRRGWLYSRLYLLMFPVSVVAIALTGAGFYTAMEGTTDESTLHFERFLMCVGPAVTWGVFAFNKMLTQPKTGYTVLREKVFCLLLGALAFLLPIALQLGPIGTGICIVCVQLYITLSQVLLDLQQAAGCVRGSVKTQGLSTFHWKAPKLLGKGEDLEQTLGKRVSSHEHFSSVLVGMVIISINKTTVWTTGDLWPYLLYYATIYASLWMVIRYSSRFDDDDMAHTLILSIFEFLLLVVCEGIRNTWNEMFGFGAAAIFVWIGTCYWLRVAANLERVRPLACYFAGLCALFAGIYVMYAFFHGTAAIICVFAGVTLVSLLCEPALTCVTSFDERLQRRLNVGMNLQYVVTRLNSLFKQMIAVAVLVPNALYFGTYEHQIGVVIGVSCAGIMAICAKSVLFDVEPVSAKRHAIASRSEFRKYCFLSIHPFTLISLCFLGGSMSQLIPAIGDNGFEAETTFAQRVFCSAVAILWASAACAKLLHKPRTDGIHYLKVALALVASSASLVPALYVSMGDLFTMIFITATTFMFVLLQLVTSAVGDQIHKIQQAAQLSKGLKAENTRSLWLV